MGSFHSSEGIRSVNYLMSAFILISVPGLPLLLAIPGLRRQLPWPSLLALIPAIVLLLIPGDAAVELPWMLLGDSGMALDSVSRWWLVMSVVVWAVAATTLNSGVNGKVSQMTWFLLSMGGQLGAVLAVDAVSFFAFSSLMGYAFFGFLIIQESDAVRRAGRVYLVLLILADIALFEALLVISTTASDLRFLNITAAIAQSPDASFPLWLALIAFALRAGLWPLHVWLPTACNSARPAVPLILWIGPVATGLLGMLRWLPLGETTSTSAGALLQIAGIATLLYATVFGLWRNRRGQGIPYLIIAATGTIVLVFGVGLDKPLTWLRYASLVSLLIVSAGLGLTIITVGKVWQQRKQAHPPVAAMPVSPALDYFESWTTTCLQWARRQGLITLPTLRTAMYGGWRHLWHKPSWRRRLDSGEDYIRRWSFAILIVLLLSILLTIAGLTTGN